MSNDALVDKFVEVVNKGVRHPVWVREGPPSVLIGEPDDVDSSDWQIKPYSGIDWIEPVEQRFGSRFPELYRSLITRYIFPGFEAAGLFFLANTPEGTDYDELRTRIFSDWALYTALHREGFLQFARPEDGSDYDPVCFDLNRSNSEDRPIVRIDHEYILCDDIVKVSDEIAGSFRELISPITGIT